MPSSTLDPQPAPATPAPPSLESLAAQLAAGAALLGQAIQGLEQFLKARNTEQDDQFLAPREQLAAMRLATRLVADHFEVTPGFLREPATVRRRQHVVWPVQVSQYVLRELGFPWKVINAWRGHATGAACHNYNRVRDRIDTEPATATEIADLLARVRNRIHEAGFKLP